MAAAPVVTGRRRELLEAAVHVTADEGLRGLTHRAVDRRAGLPEGTCSAYLRTKQQLLLALAEHVTRLVVADVDALATQLSDRPLKGPAGQEEAVSATRRLFEHWLDEREVLLTRVELTMEASRNEPVGDLLAACRNRLVAVVDRVLTARDREHTAFGAEAMVAAFDGMLLAALLKPAEQRRAFLTDSLSVILDALTAPAS